VHYQMNQRIVLITGGTKGIGLAIAKILTDSGARVIISGSNPTRGLEAKNHLIKENPSRDVTFIQCDITSLKSLQQLANEVEVRFGYLNGLINNARIEAKPVLFAEMISEEITVIVNNLLVCYLQTTRELLPLMKKAPNGASIVNIGSDAARVGTPGEVVISAAKGGVHSATKSLAAELSRDNIRVNTVSISLTSGTGGYDDVMSDSFSRKIFEKAKAKMRLGVPSAEDVAHAATFLTSPLSQKITGQILSVNGGLSFPG
jgi:2-hydroxycyclohexanecarboxyl-CoA dehydrogenase